MKRIAIILGTIATVIGVCIPPSLASTVAHRDLTPAVTCSGNSRGLITSYGGYSLKDVNQYNQGPVTISLTNITNYCFVQASGFPTGEGYLIQYGTNWALAQDVGGGPQGQNILTVQTKVNNAGWQIWGINCAAAGGWNNIVSYWNSDVLTQGAVGGEQFLTPWVGSNAQLWETLINTVDSC